MTKSTEDKLQKIELETVKAVTELKADVKNLTEIIKELRETIQVMANNYVRKEEMVKEVSDLRLDLEDAKKAGKVRAILWSVLTALITSILIYELTKAIR